MMLKYSYSFQRRNFCYTISALTYAFIILVARRTKQYLYLNFKMSICCNWKMDPIDIMISSFKIYIWSVVGKKKIKEVVLLHSKAKWNIGNVLMPGPFLQEFGLRRVVQPLFTINN